jgi:23S rRNA pseudouridine2605 synthase
MQKIKAQKKRATMSEENKIRLQKVLANAGVGSRRVCEEMITQGRIEVNEKTVVELGTKVDPIQDVIRADGKRIKLSDDHITIALYKPVGFVSAMKDDQGRPTLADLIGDRYGRLFHIGRLDTNSEGLILMTNDGDLAQKIAHPSNNITKTYVVTVLGKIKNGTLSKLTHGLELSDGFSKFDSAKIIGVGTEQSIIEVNLHSGKNRIIRRMFKKVGHKVTKLVRVQIDKIRIGELKPGKSRVLGVPEIATLESSARQKGGQL